MDKVMEKTKTALLADRVKSGDIEAFNELYTMKIKGILYMSAKLLNNNIADAEDAAQKVIITVYQNIAGLKDVNQFDSWMYKIVLNTCANVRRQNQKVQYGELDEGKVMIEEEMRKEFIPHIYAEDQELREWLLGIIDEMPKKQKTCVLLHYYEQLSYEEIAQVMGVSVSAVGKLLMRSRAHLEQKINKKTGGKQNLYSIGSVPVLSVILASDAESTVTAEAITAVSRSVEKIIANVSGAGAAGTAANIAATSGMSLGAKIIAIVVISASITAIGAVGGSILNNVQDPISTAEEGAIDVPQQDEIPSDAVDMGIDIDEEEAGESIETLGDMIGHDNEAVFLDFLSSGTSDGTALHTFLNEIGMRVDTEMKGTHENYTMYVQDKETKRFIVIEHEYNGSYDLAYRFTTSQEELPHFTDVGYTFWQWR